MRDASNNLRPGKVPGTGVARRAPIEGNLRWRRDSELYMSDPRGCLVLLSNTAGVLASGVLRWALLRGRRPEPVNLRWSTVPRPPGFARRASGAGVEVVDVQVREVHEVRDMPPAPEIDGPPPR